MTRLFCAAAICALAIGTAARAGDVDVAPLATSVTQLGDAGTVIHGGVGVPAGTQVLTDGSRSLNYSSTYSVTSSEISFESGGIGIGDQTRTSSTSRIDMTVNNNGDGSVGLLLKSQITAAGMGIYLGDNTAGNCFTSPGACAQSRGDHTFSQLGQTTGANLIAGVSVDFQILQDNNVDNPLYHVAGSLALTQDGRVFIDQNTDQLSSSLNGFVTLDQFGKIDPTTGRSNSALGFAWDATDITLDNIAPIGGFSSSTISYIVSVTTLSNSTCFSDSTCLVTYAGFGDPIGRGGDISSAAFGAFRGFNFSGPSGPDYISGVNFSPVTLTYPHLDDNGNLIFGQPGVPEPATWALSIMGFGLLGAAMRRRRVLARA